MVVLSVPRIHVDELVDTAKEITGAINRLRAICGDPQTADFLSAYIADLQSDSREEKGNSSVDLSSEPSAKTDLPLLVGGRDAKTLFNL
jgi:hypothetical protein